LPVLTRPASTTTAPSQSAAATRSAAQTSRTATTVPYLQAHAAQLTNLKVAVITEDSYATDHNGAYAASTSSSTNRPRSDQLVAYGLALSRANSLTAKVFTTSAPDDSFCLADTSADTQEVWYLSSVDDAPTAKKPAGC
jgi:hypothetical protein